MSAALEVELVCRQAYRDNPGCTKGLFAYRYELQSDGSCIAFWADDPAGTVKQKGFASLADASRWSPRNEA